MGAAFNCVPPQRRNELMANTKARKTKTAKQKTATKTITPFQKNQAVITDLEKTIELSYTKLSTHYDKLSTVAEKQFAQIKGKADKARAKATKTRDAKAKAQAKYKLKKGNATVKAQWAKANQAFKEASAASDALKIELIAAKADATSAKQQVKKFTAQQRVWEKFQKDWEKQTNKPKKKRKTARKAKAAPAAQTMMATDAA